jgi:hypothetical protein
MDNHMKLSYFWVEDKAHLYRFISDPVSDPDSNQDPKPLFRFWIGSASGQKFRILLDPDPQHYPEHFKKVSKRSVREQQRL